MTNWLESILCKLKNCTCPILFTDLNDGMGVHKLVDQSGFHNLETNAVHVAARRKERISGGAGEQLRQVMETHELCSLSSWKDDRDTYHGNFGSSLIDHLIGPSALATSLRSSGPL